MKCRRTGNRISWFLRLALFCAAAWFSGSLIAQASASTPTSQAPEALWQSLRTITSQLPSQFDSFTQSLTAQTNLLIASNASLQANVASLQTSNAQLTLSLKTSQAQAVTLENQLKLLQADLNDSTKSIILAQTQAKSLEAQLGVARIGFIAAGVVAVVLMGYEGGRVTGAWK